MGATDTDRRLPFIIAGLSQLDVQEQLSWCVLLWPKQREKDIDDEFRGKFLADLLSEELLDKTDHPFLLQDLLVVVFDYRRQS